MKHRLWNHFRASWGGYFWMPCPLCGQMMGGHEWKHFDGLESSIPDPKYPAGSGRGIGICQDCTIAGKGYSLPFDPPKPVTVHWYDHDCEWVTKYCEEHHVRTARIPADVLGRFALSHSKRQVDESGFEA